MQHGERANLEMDLARSSKSHYPDRKGAEGWHAVWSYTLSISHFLFEEHIVSTHPSNTIVGALVLMVSPEVSSS